MKTKSIRVFIHILAFTLATAACGRSSPVKAFEAVFDAMRKRDVAALKKTFSKHELEKLEKAAHNASRSSDEVLAMVLDSYPERLPERLETRNVKIEGERATLEFQAKTGDWKTANFAWEDGEWKFLFEGFRP
ncbi:MAG TPA: hypothetical protein VF791_07425 [Pyrinomonadaceae bacterium]